MLFRSENKSDHSWADFAQLLTNIVTLAAYCSISLAFAEYQKTEWIYYFSIGAVGIMGVLAAWDLICLINWDKWKKYFLKFWEKGKKLISWIKRIYPRIRFAVPAVILTAVLAVYNYHDTKYYKDVTEIYGVPMGIGESMSTEERKNSAEYWEIRHYPFKHKVELTFQESYGQMKVMKDYSTVYGMRIFQPTSRIVCEYRKGERDKYRELGQTYFMTARENGFRELRKASYYGSDNRLLLELERTEDSDKFQITSYSSEDMPQLLNSTLLRDPEDHNTSKGMLSRQIEIVYNEDGLPQTRKFGKRACNLFGINGEMYVYDQNKRMTALYYLDINGEPVCNKLGIMMMTFRYDERNNLQSISYFSDEKGTKETEGFYGVFCERFQYDAQGNLIERRQLDRSENRANDVNGICIYQYFYDGAKLTGEKFLNYDRVAAEHEKLRSSYVGFEKETEFNQTKIVVTLGQEEIQEDRLKEAQKLQGKELERWENGEKIFEAAEKTADRIYDYQEGLDRGSSELNESNQEKTADGKEGSEDIKEIREKTLTKSDIFFDQESNLTSDYVDQEKNSDGMRKYSSIQYIMGPKYNILSVSYFDKEKKLVENEMGYAEKRFGYDEKLRLTDEWYFNLAGKPCLNKDGFSMVRYEYDNQNDDQLKAVYYMDTEKNQIINRRLGYAAVRYQWSTQSEDDIKITTYWDTQGNLIPLAGMGYVKKEQTYNESGFLIQESYFDEKGNPVCRMDYGVAEILYDYGDDGNLICERYKGKDGKPVNRLDTGCAVVYTEFESGKLVKEYYEAYWKQMLRAMPDKNTGAVMIKYIYDNGNKVKEEYLDGDGQPVLRKDIGCAARQFEYNDRGRLQALYHYGTEGQLVLQDEGYAVIRYQYDRRGKCRSEEHTSELQSQR